MSLAKSYYPVSLLFAVSKIFKITFYYYLRKWFQFFLLEYMPFTIVAYGKDSKIIISFDSACMAGREGVAL